jgi:hypothetical protein
MRELTSSRRLVFTAPDGTELRIRVEELSTSV